MSIRVSGFSHGITNENSQQMVSETFGFFLFFLSPSRLQRPLSDLINRAMNVTQPRSSGRLMRSVKLRTSVADHAWRSVVLSVIQNLNVSKGLILKRNQRADKTLGVLFLMG